MIPQHTHQFKIVLVGDSSVGKSSILTRFVDDQFTDNLLATIGVDFKFRRLKVQNQQIKIQIWDTAGQQTFRSLVSAYYHSADAILIVYDLSVHQSFQSVVEYWAKEAQNNNKNNACVFLLGNKCDLDMQQRKVQKQQIHGLLEKYQIVKQYELSAKTGQKIQATFVDICKILLSKNKGSKKKQNQNGRQYREDKNNQNFKVNKKENSQPVEGNKKKKCC